MDEWIELNNLPSSYTIDPQEEKQALIDFPAGSKFEQQFYTAYDNNNSTNNIYQTGKLPSASAQQPPMASAIAGAAIGAGGSVGSSWINLIGNGITTAMNNSTTKRGQDIQAQIANRALDIEYQKFNREWDAANNAGLLSPAQFGNMGNSSTYYTNNGSSAAISRHLYGTWNSVWS